MLELTNKEKDIYNCYLKHSRKGEPYTLRKDFSDLDVNVATCIKKIFLLISRYPHINFEDFFKAFNVLHPEEKYPHISYFTTLAATKTYSIFKKQEEDEDPEKQFDKIKDSFHFIGMFCLENKIPLEKYSTHKTGYMISWLNHYREHRINPYSLMEFNGIYETFTSLPKDEIELFANNLYEKLIAYKTRYKSSKATQDLVKGAMNKIKEFVKNNLHFK